MKTIREAAEEFGVTTRTIRYYEELGMLKPERTSANQRMFSNAEIAKLKLIDRGKKYGFTLDEIKEMVLLFDADRSGKKQLERTIEYGKKQIQVMEERIGELEKTKKEMEFLLGEFSAKLSKLKGMGK
ncbi:MerR family DNA-binding transcriptional regulator [Planococcus sp. APC 3906]|uniref:MerR family transcriptional regulator n=1 Tax=Planococcus sp. APC 3906 TaxID=3035194 RepID=UPI0025B32E32|nr:MerR family DNA-binding transcriptional regulator [Planococcus sp. APC 3906]MDN3451534.1 MerR family DNA-binding transcriptional regulator [Planococcus sp. APC 3906]